MDSLENWLNCDRGKIVIDFIYFYSNGYICVCIYCYDELILDSLFFVVIIIWKVVKVIWYFILVIIELFFYLILYFYKNGYEKYWVYW